MPEDCPNPAAPDLDISNDLAAQAPLYRLLVENSVDVIIRYNAARERIYVSPSSFEMLGIRPVDMVGAINAARIHPNDFARVVRCFARSAKRSRCFSLASGSRGPTVPTSAARR